MQIRDGKNLDPGYTFRVRNNTAIYRWLTSAKDPTSGPEEEEHKSEKAQECGHQNPDGVGIPRHNPVLEFREKSATAGRQGDSFRTARHCF
jgi:hypothetical protein